METITLLSPTTIYNLYDETTFSQGDTVVLTNNTSNEVFIFRGSTSPSSGEGFPLPIGKTSTVSGKVGENIYVYGALGTIIVQDNLNSIIETSAVYFPYNVWTSTDQNTRRLKVEAAPTAFWEGREYYCLAKGLVTGSQGSELAYKFTFTTDVLFEFTDITIVTGEGTVEVWQGGTDNGGFTTPVPIFSRNTMSDSPNIPTGTSKFSGGVYNKDGTLIDYIDLDSGGGSSTPDGGNILDKVGVPAGDYYFLFRKETGTDVKFLFKEVWEER